MEFRFPDQFGWLEVFPGLLSSAFLIFNNSNKTHTNLTLPAF
jgi:hypothetical protein